jgi:hypothetical protein
VRLRPCAWREGGALKGCLLLDTEETNEEGAAYGIECKGCAQCSRETKGKTVRIPLDTDRRIFVPIPRSSYKWQRIYNGRTAVERVNSRIDLSFGFEHHFIRGKANRS